MSKKDIMTEIITLCMKLDIKAYSIYRKFSLESKNEELSKSWQQCALEEKEHISVWKNALKLFDKNTFPSFFNDCGSVKEKLLELNKRAEKTFDEIKVRKKSTSEELRTAYYLESFMLNPDMLFLMEFFNSQESENMADYHKHIQGFINMLEKYGKKSENSNLDILADTLKNLFEKNIQVVKESNIDPLSRILNRIAFFKNIKPFLYLAERKKYKAGIIMGDIDDFKSINDTYGHPEGDKVIKTVSELIKDNIRANDICARYGGDEFIVFLMLENSNDLNTICRRINTEIRNKSEEKCGIKVKISLGAAFRRIKNHEKNLSELIKKADDNLLKAKNEGKNRWIISPLN